jgi:hypothetical protein
MKKLSLILCGLLVLFTLSAQQKKSGISVSLPEGWAKVEGSVLEHQYLKNGASFMIKEETALNGKSLNDAVAMAKQQIGKYFKDYKLLKEEKITVDGKDAKSITYNYSAQAGKITLKMTMHTVYVMVNGKCQTLSFGSTTSQFNSLMPDIQYIIKNVKFR